MKHSQLENFLNDELSRLKEERGFTAAHIRQKAIDILKGFGITVPSENEVSDMIKVLKLYISKHSMGKVMGEQVIKEGKGKSAADKVIKQLREKIFPKLSDDELEEFKDTIKEIL